MQMQLPRIANSEQIGLKAERNELSQKIGQLKPEKNRTKK